MVTENIYYTYVKRKLKSFRNAKTLVNLYPKNKQENVKEFVDINNVNFKKFKRNTEATVSILNQIEKDKIIFLPNVIHHQLNLLSIWNSDKRN